MDVCVCVCVHVRVLSCYIMSGSCNPMNCSPPGSSVHRISKARIFPGCHFLLQGMFLTQYSMYSRPEANVMLCVSFTSIWKTALTLLSWAVGAPGALAPGSSACKAGTWPIHLGSWASVPSWKKWGTWHQFIFLLNQGKYVNESIFNAFFFKNLHFFSF